MKLFVVSAAVLFAVICTASAEPPRYRSRYAAPAATPAPAPEKFEAPYPPSGWKPSGRAFTLPKQAPKDEPKDKYGPPPPVTEYGPPTTEEAATTTELPTTTDVTDTTEETTDPPQSREEEEEEAAEEEEEAGSTAVSNSVAQQLKAEQQQRLGSGVYYVFLPDGRLQRVAYTNQPNQQYFQQLNAAPQPINAGYLAIQYQDVQPIQAPVYSYGPSQELVRVF